MSDCDAALGLGAGVGGKAHGKTRARRRRGTCWWDGRASVVRRRNASIGERDSRLERLAELGARIARPRAACEGRDERLATARAACDADIRGAVGKCPFTVLGQSKPREAIACGKAVAANATKWRESRRFDASRAERDLLPAAVVRVQADGTIQGRSAAPLIRLRWFVRPGSVMKFTISSGRTAPGIF